MHASNKHSPNSLFRRREEKKTKLHKQLQDSCSCRLSSFVNDRMTQEKNLREENAKRENLHIKKKRKEKKRRKRTQESEGEQI